MSFCTGAVIWTNTLLSHHHLQTSCQPFVYFGKGSHESQQACGLNKDHSYTVGTKAGPGFLLAPPLVISTWLPFNSPWHKRSTTAESVHFQTGPGLHSGVGTGGPPQSGPSKLVGRTSTKKLSPRFDLSLRTTAVTGVKCEPPNLC